VTLTPEEVARLSRLARLKLGEAEAAALRSDLTAILAKFEEVSGAAATAPSSPESPTLALREDVPAPAPPEEVEGIVAAFPRRKDRAVDVPRSLP